ncbi:MAG: hypothetical protein Fur0035_22010 [Anaerolineales bacterium]
MMKTQRSIAPVVTKLAQAPKSSDFAYWQTCKPEERIAALEEIRREYHQWKYDAEPRLQRVYTIVKR